MGCYEQPAITAITPVMAAPITLSGVKLVSESRTYGQRGDRGLLEHLECISLTHIQGRGAKS